MTTTIDPYATLGIPAGASRADAARAHRRLAKRYHPDVNPGPDAAERMRRINEAWRMISTGSWRASTPSAPRTATTWTTWPESRRPAGPRMRRPSRPEPMEPSFGDRPGIVAVVGVGLALLYFVGTWLGSLAPAP